MKKLITILGILLTVTILISGSAAAAWHYVTVLDSLYCTDIDYIEGIDDTYQATIGSNPLTLGWILLDLSAEYAMPPDQEFWVNSSGSDLSEDYNVFVQETDQSTPQYVGSDDDQGSHSFTTPPTFGKTWRYVLIVGDSGDTNPQDPIYGPEIDAVGWDIG